ncbi:MAG: ankyrin repeat domain-containing protein [Saprospiraceae bacterium]
MKTIDHLLSEAFISALGWTLIHALWQGALLAIVLAILLVVTHRYSSRTRYFIAIISLFLFALSTIVSFSLLYNPNIVEANNMSIDHPEMGPLSVSVEEDATENTKVPELSTAAKPKHSTALFQQTQAYFSQHLPLIVTLWMLGVVALLLRFLGSLAYIQRLRSYRTESLSNNWLKKGEALSRQLKINKKIAFMASHRVLTPLAIGIFRPVILLPSSLLTGLTEQQVETILLHELAHIKRNDYLINVLQTLVDILFFYHPAIWWISATIRNERENCCDDTVISITGETGNYARTLILLKEQEINTKKLPAMAFTGIKYKFNDRIKRLFNPPRTIADFREGFVTALVLVIGITAIAINAFGTPSLFANGKEQHLDQDAAASTLQIPQAATLELEQEDALEAGVSYAKKNNSLPQHTLGSNPSDVHIENSDLDLLLEAIEDDKLDLVKFMIEKGTDVNAQNNEGWTPLMQAVEGGNMTIINLLLEKGADINQQDKEGHTALFVAAEEGDMEITKMLIQKGAKVDIKTGEGWNAFMEAVDEGQMEMAELLINKGADVNAYYGDDTPLMEAINEGHIDMVKLLLQKGADPNKKDQEGYTPLMEAANEGYIEMVKLLLDKGADVNAQSENGNTALMEAVDEGHLEITRLLLNKGAKISIGGDNGFSAFFEAVEEGHVDIVNLFLANGVDVNAMNEHGYTPLMEAVDEGNLQMAQLLIAKGAKINLHDEDGQTALMEAADEGHLEIVKLLLDKGANINEQYEEGSTPLMEAAKEGHVELVKFLISRGADVNAKREGGQTVLMEVVDEGHLAIVEILIEKGADVNAQTSMEQTYINNGKVVTRIQSGWTALFEAIHEDQPKIVQLLLSKGASINATIQKITYDVKNDKRTQHDNWTPLMEAVEEENLQVIKILLDHKADINATTKAGKRILDIAKETGNTTIIQFIADRSAK